MSNLQRKTKSFIRIGEALFFFVALFVFSSMSGHGADMRENLRFWLENMIWYHGYSAEEAAAGLGMSKAEVVQHMHELNITSESKPAEDLNGLIRVMPWAPGRHPRIGFLEGAINPQRDTKLSIFLPWKNSGFVVFDLPEAVFANKKLLYLAHTHVPTVWDEMGEKLEQIDWRVAPDGTLLTSRILPNMVSFGARAYPGKNEVAFEYWIMNASDQRLIKVRSQLCLMLKNAPDFNDQTKDNKVLMDCAAAVRSRDGNRWIVTAWKETGRAWQNAPVPCIHADPVFSSIRPAGYELVRGKIFFWTGTDIRSEVERRRDAGILFE